MLTLNTCKDIYKFISNDKNIVIYGAGNYGQILFWYLRDILKSAKTIIIAETNSQKDIVSIHEIEKKENYSIFVAASEKYADEMLSIVKKYSFANIGIISEDLYAELICKKREINFTHNDQINMINTLEKKISKFQKQPRYEYVVLNILNHCNLRCKGCDHFACIAEPYFVSYESVKKEVERLSEITCGHITKIGIMGGEPLLHPDLLKILKSVRYFFPNTILRLTSNGILLNQQNQRFWDTCRDNNIIIVVTKYPLRIDFEKIEETAKKNDVKLQYYEGTGGDTIKTSFKKTINPKGDLNPNESFMKCNISNYGNFLMEGKMYCCPFAGNVHIFNKKYGYNLEVTEEDYINIYDSNVSYDKLLEFSARSHQFCRYCDVDHREYGLIWETSKQNPYEWLIEEDN